jgi:hypothetical protein
LLDVLGVIRENDRTGRGCEATVKEPIRDAERKRDVSVTTNSDVPYQLGTAAERAVR